MQLTFANVPLLWVLSAWILLGFGVRRARAHWPLWVAAGLFTLAAAGPALRVTHTPEPWTVIAVDRSVSLDGRLPELQLALEEAAATFKDASPVYLEFAEQARMLDAQAAIPRLTDTQSQLGNGTSFRSALALATASTPSGRPLQLVLITDGLGMDSLPEIPEGTELIIHTLTGREPGPSIRSLNGPLRTEGNVPVQLDVSVEAGSYWRGEIVILADGIEIARRNVQGNGSEEIQFNDVALPEHGLGSVQLQATGQFEKDPLTIDNFASYRIRRRGASRVILVTPFREESPVHAALAVQGIQVTTFHPRRLPTEPEFWATTAATLLEAVTADDLADSTESMMAERVEQGMGLLWFGHPERAGSRDLPRGRISELLPLALDPPVSDGDLGEEEEDPKPARVPMVSLFLVIDASGSMGGLPMKMVREAAIATVETLDAVDRVGVIGFADDPTWIVRPTNASRPREIVQAISRMRAQGGTRFFSPLQTAFQAMMNEPSKVKHIVFLTDGVNSDPADYKSLIEKMADNKITITTIGVGSAGNLNIRLLGNFASWGGGRFHITSDVNEVPQIFTRESRVVYEQADALRPKEPKTPRPTSPSKQGTDAQITVAESAELLTGLKNWPISSGHYASRTRTGTRVLLKAGDDPLLAIGRWGRGRTAVWASSFEPQWAEKVLKWEQSTAFLGQLLRWLTPDPTIQISMPEFFTEKRGSVIMGWLDAPGPGPYRIESDGHSVWMQKSEQGFFQVNLPGEPGSMHGGTLYDPTGVALQRVRWSIPANREWASRNRSGFSGTHGSIANWKAFDDRSILPWFVAAGALFLLVELALRKLRGTL